MTSTHDYANIEPGLTTDPSSGIDDFEDGDVAEYSGDTGSFSAQQATVYQGSYAGEIADGDNFVYSLDGDGLPYYPQAGDDFKARLYPEDQAKPKLAFGVQDSNNYYLLRYDDELALFEFAIVSSGSESVQESLAVSSEDTQWLEYVVSWGSGGTIKYALDDAQGTRLGSGSTSDSSYTSGGWGWGEESVNTLTENLFAQYRFEQDLTDEVGSKDLSADGAPTYTTNNKEGSYAISFDGTDDNATTGEISMSDMGGSYSVTFWAKFDDLDTGNRGFGVDGGAIAENSTQDVVEWVDWDASGTAYLYAWSDIGSGDVGSWVHLAAVSDPSSNELRLYVNGNEDSGSPHSDSNLDEDAGYAGDPNFSMADLQSQGYNWAVDVDDYRLYSDAKTDSEISEIYNNY